MECSYETESMKKYWVFRFSNELLKLLNNVTGSILLLGCGLCNLWLMGRIPRGIFDGVVAMAIVCLQSTVLWSISESQTRFSVYLKV